MVCRCRILRSAIPKTIGFFGLAEWTNSFSRIRGYGPWRAMLLGTDGGVVFRMPKIRGCPGRELWWCAERKRLLRNPRCEPRECVSGIK
jgi:hypothetical protein